MTKAIIKQKIKKQKVLFSVKAPEANDVFLAGDFNNWDPEALPMEKDDEGVWKRMLKLESSLYEYKFIIDGEWKTDPQNSRMCSNRFGTENNMLAVS
ncbi:MAG: glycogen-binding domain-containing protein [Pseudomonadota bacterium]